MIGTLQIAASGLEVSSRRLDVAANNTANASTVGFKSSDLVTSEAAPSGTGATVVGTARSQSQGPLQMTNVPSDIAINGRGFFAIETASGSTAFTRDGKFTPDSEGYLRTSSGDYLLEEEAGARVRIPPDIQSFTMSPGGKITGIDDMGNEVELASVNLAMFASEENLKPLGSGLFSSTAASGSAQTGAPQTGGRGSLVGGALEMSNVNFVNELVESLIARTTFEANAGTIRTADEMLETLSRV